MRRRQWRSNPITPASSKNYITYIKIFLSSSPTTLLTNTKSKLKSRTRKLHYMERIRNETQNVWKFSFNQISHLTSNRFNSFGGIVRQAKGYKTREGSRRMRKFWSDPRSGCSWVAGLNSGQNLLQDHYRELEEEERNPTPPASFQSAVGRWINRQKIQPGWANRESGYGYYYFVLLSLDLLEFYFCSSSWYFRLLLFFLICFINHF